MILNKCLPLHDIFIRFRNWFFFRFSFPFCVVQQRKKIKGKMQKKGKKINLTKLEKLNYIFFIVLLLLLDFVTPGCVLIKQQRNIYLTQYFAHTTQTSIHIQQVRERSTQNASKAF